jgi:nucleoside-diphosphate-sugar epimerase
VEIVARIAGKRITKRYDVTKPQGVRGRNSDNSKLRRVLKWEPQISLEKGLEITYKWIQEQVSKKDHSARNQVTSVRSSQKLNEGFWR